MAPREREVIDDDQKVKDPATKSVLSKDDEWIDKMDLKAFREDIKELGKRLSDEQGPDDVKHLHKMIMWSNSCAAVGLLTMGFGVNPISVIGLSLYAFTTCQIVQAFKLTESERRHILL